MKRVLVALTIAAATLALAACGSSKKSSSSTAAPSSSSQAQTQSTAPAPAPSSAGGSSVSISADPSGALKFDTSQATAKAGKVVIKFSNPAQLSHGLSLEGPGVDKEGQVVGSGGSSTLNVDLKPGKYTFYCPVPGHRQAGMQGTLTVQ